MSRKRYSEYKASGVEWLDEIPEHWETKPVKRVARFYTGWTPPTGRDEYFVGDNLWANITDLGPKVLMDTAKRVSDGAINESRLQLSPKGSLLFSFKLSVGQVSIAGTDMYTNEAIATFPPSNGTDIAYLYWAAPSYIPHNADENIYGAKLLNQDLIKNARMAIPPEDEQRAIVAFLDRETARIDALVEKKARQMELLLEKRAALISHAVTKGLDPNAKVQDSGIEWLDKVPGHWGVKRLKRIASIRGRIGFRGYSAQDLVDEGDGALTLGGSNLTDNGLLDLSRRTHISWVKYEESPEIKVSVGDLIIGQRGTCGNVVSIDREIGAATINPSLVLIKNPQTDSRYLLYWLLGQFTQSVLDSYLNATAVPMLSQEQIGNITVLLPTCDEQHAIAAFLDRETGRIDTLAERVRLSIDTLREYRTALISAAVTGKIDVREVTT